ncbi:MAG: DMT family transporter [Actinomycetota bacterium]
MERNPSRATLGAFVAAVVIGGTNFLAVRYSNEDLAPLFGATVRFATAALFLLAVTRLRRLPLPHGAEAVGAGIWGLMGFGLAYGLLYYALVGLSAGTTSVIVAASPLVTLALAVVHGQERFSLPGILGGCLAIAGIGLVSIRSLGGDLSPRYLIAALLAVVAIAESSVVIKGFPQAHPVTTNAVGMGIGALFLAPTSLVLGEAWTMPRLGRTWLVLVYLVVVGSVGLFGLFLFVIKTWTASASVYALALMPVVAVSLGTVIADEPVTWELLAGTALVIAAVYVAVLSGRRQQVT